MKRSEALQTMLDTDKGWRMCIESSGNYRVDQLNRMENILKTLELIGMLPPEAADFNLGNTWEPEDEEK